MGNITYDFTGKSVIVTGAARGIGQALARHFAEAKATVFMVDFDKDELDKAAREVGAIGIPADVSDTGDVENVVSTVIAETGRVDILINNAGILRDKVLWKLTDEDWDQVLQCPRGRHVSVHPGLCSALPEAGIRAGRQHHLLHRAARQPRAGQLRHREGRDHRVHQDRRERARCFRGHRECDLPERRDPDDRLHPEGEDRRGHRSDLAVRRPRRDGRRHLLPRLRGSRLHHRSRPPGRRRHLHLSAPTL